MTVYSVSYDLNKEGQNYKDLIAEIKSFNGYIDGKWILLTYDYKKDLFIYTLDERCPEGELNFEMVVTDDAGNAATYKCTFKN